MPSTSYPGGYGSDPYGGQPSGGSEHYIDIDRLWLAGRRQLTVILSAVLAALIAGLAYLMFADKQYTSATEVLIDPRVRQVVTESSGSNSGSGDDEASILSQIEVAKSRQVVNKVIEALRTPATLEKLPSGELRDALEYSSSATADPTGGESTDWAASLLAGGFDAERVGKTSVLSFSFQSQDPLEAALVANTFAQVFISAQLDTKFDASRQAGDFLLARLQELKDQTQRAERAVQKFREEHKLAEADGRLLSDQQLSQLSTQYVTAQAETASAEARYNRLKQIIDTKDTGAVVEDALGSGIINDLRRRYLEATRQLQDLLTKVGPEHEQAKRLENEKRSFEELIFTELGRIAEASLSELRVAQKRQQALEESFGSMVGASTDVSRTLVDLRELERTAEIYKSIYTTTLERYEQSSQGQAFPVSDVRIISFAKPSTIPSSPKTTMVLALAGIVGAGLGIGIGAIREYRDRSIRTGDQIRRELGLEFLGEVPLVQQRRLKSKDAAPASHATRFQPVAIESPLLKYAASHPMSAFAETLRAVRHTLNRRHLAQGGARIIGFGSLVPGEGKTTLSVNFATLAARSGARVLLVDTDFRNPAMSRAIAPTCTLGFAEAIHEDLDVHDVVYEDPATNLSVLPINVGEPQAHSSELLASAYVADALAQLSTEYDLIVFDLPPIGPIVDVRILVPMMDMMVLVVEWGRLPSDVIRAAMEAEYEVFERCGGVILNKVDAARNKLYISNSARSYLSHEYAKYYRNENAA
jgi:succinoglycan biosynthesis transport protein ExoP